MSPGLETEQMLDTKGKRPVGALKLEDPPANWPSVANVIFVQLQQY